MYRFSNKSSDEISLAVQTCVGKKLTIKKSFFKNCLKLKILRKETYIFY